MSEQADKPVGRATFQLQCLATKKYLEVRPTEWRVLAK